MKTSVVMATYNGAKYIVEQLDSILNQTRSVDEVIICDDVSSDETVSIVRQYINEKKLNSNWKLYVNEKNLGFADNFNRAVNLADGEYIFFSDQDDIWDKDKIRIMVDYMEQNQECKVLCTDYDLFYSCSDAPEAPKSVLDRMTDDGSIEKIQLTHQNVNMRTLGCCMCIRRSFRDEAAAYWVDGWAQDDRFWRLAVCVDGCYLLHRKLIRHRMHDNNTASFNKYHTKECRVKLFREKQAANLQMLALLKDRSADGQKLGVVTDHVSAMDMRLELLEKHKLWLAFPLMRYAKCYESAKSMLVDVLISFR